MIRSILFLTCFSSVSPVAEINIQTDKVYLFCDTLSRGRAGFVSSIVSPARDNQCHAIKRDVSLPEKARLVLPFASLRHFDFFNWEVSVLIANLRSSDSKTFRGPFLYKKKQIDTVRQLCEKQKLNEAVGDS